MYIRSLISKLLLAVFVMAAVFGLYPMAQGFMDNATGCHHAAMEHSLCASPFEHVAHWQATFFAILAELVIFALALHVLHTRYLHQLSTNPSLARWRLQEQDECPPDFLVELFSSGILNPKKPHHT